MGEREAAWEAQRGILVGDAERLREELSEVVRERDALRLRVEAIDSEASSNANLGEGGLIAAPPSSGAGAKLKLAEYMTERKAYEAEIGELSLTNNALREEMRVKEETISEERR